MTPLEKIAQALAQIANGNDRAGTQKNMLSMLGQSPGARRDGLNLLAALSTKFAPGDKVTVKAGKEHDGMTRGGTGIIKEISTPAIGIKFSGMDMIHKWYTDDELEPAKEGDKKKSGNMKGMKM